MNSQLNVIRNLMDELDDILENKCFSFGSLTVVNKETIIDILDNIYAALPDEIKEASALLKRKDELQYEAQQRAEKIVSDAQIEADRLLSESNVLRAVHKEAERIKDQVIADCEDIKRKALEEAEVVRTQAVDEALRTKDGASVYAEQVLVSLEQNINQLYEVIKNGQVQLEKRRSEYEEQIPSVYNDQQPEYAQDFKVS